MPYHNKTGNQMAGEFEETYGNLGKHRSLTRKEERRIFKEIFENRIVGYIRRHINSGIENSEDYLLFSGFPEEDRQIKEFADKAESIGGLASLSIRNSPDGIESRLEFVEGSRKLVKSVDGSSRISLYNPAARELSDLVIKSNYGLIGFIYSKYPRFGVTLSDFFQEGIIKAINSIDTFSLNRGTRFTTYLTSSLMRISSKMWASSMKDGIRTAIDDYEEKLIKEGGEDNSHERKTEYLDFDYEEALEILDPMRRKVLEMYLGGKGRQEIAASLHEDGVAKIIFSNNKISHLKREALRKLRFHLKQFS